MTNLQGFALLFRTFIIRNVLLETHMGAYGLGKYLPWGSVVLQPPAEGSFKADTIYLR